MFPDSVRATATIAACRQTDSPPQHSCALSGGKKPEDMFFSPGKPPATGRAPDSVGENAGAAIGLFARLALPNFVQIFTFHPLTAPPSGDGTSHNVRMAFKS